METSNNTNRHYPQEGTEIRLRPVRTNLLSLLMLFLMLVGSILLFNAIWDQPSTAYSGGYNTGYKLGLLARMMIKEGGAWYMIGWLLIYLALQYGALFFFSGKNRHAIRFMSTWASIGWGLYQPIPLKYYRIMLFTPSLLLGWLPLLHGFCTGSFGWFALGLWGLFCSCVDFYLLWKLRSFDDEDRIVNEKGSLNIRIIKQAY